MPRYVALLKGINVGRNKRIAMVDLRALLSGLGYEDVVTYLASGNALFTTSSRKAPASLAADIEARIAFELEMAVPVIIRSPRELAAVLARNPLRGEPENPSRYFVGFFAAATDPSTARSLERDLRSGAPAGDAIWVSGAEAFFWCPGGFSLLDHAAAIERRLGVAVTTRTWNTVTKLSELAPA